jgi:hypothetical protein
MQYPVDSIVFDLDKTLIYTSSSSVAELYRSGILEDPKFFPAQKRIYYFDLPSSRPGKADKVQVEGVTSMWGTLRPYAREFLEFCFRRFKRVIVFTAGTADYAIPICDVLFRGISKPYMIWARGHCIRVREKAKDVDRRLVDLGYYPSLSIPDDSEEFEYMNAKLLDRVARVVAEVEDDRSITKDQFIIVEDNYHSFITHDFQNAFLIPAYESSSKADPTALPGSPGYSPARQKLLNSEQGGAVDDEEDEEDEEEGDGAVNDKRRSLLDIHLVQNPQPTRLRRNAKYSWLLYPDNTLQRLQKFIEDFPHHDAKMYTDGWNALN